MKPHSIFPRARRISSLIVSVLAILGVLWGAIATISRFRSEYDLLRIEVNRGDLKLAGVAAQCAVDDRRLHTQLVEAERAVIELRISLEALLHAQPARTRETKAYDDAKLALERAKALQVHDSWP